MKESKITSNVSTGHKGAALAGAQNTKKWLFIKLKLTEFKFKTSNRRRCNNVIRKRVPNINDPISKEVTVFSGGNMMLT